MAGREIVVGVSGASGALLARRFVEVALTARGLARLHVVFSEASLQVARGELDPGIVTARDWVSRLEARKAAAGRIQVHDNGEVGASIASGSYPVSGMIVVPCSAGTLGAIANGISRDLLQRAADVTLKERRPLILCFRESPYSLIHIENMRRASLAGATIAPPSPAFYISEPSVERFLDAYCLRTARLLGLEVSGESFQWKGTPSPEPDGKTARSRRRR
jgi:4-hydroxy-3-polyprenylbenzoate decarboxylase